MLLAGFNGLSAQDHIYLANGDTLECRIILNTRKEKINPRTLGIHAENLYEYVAVEFQNDSVRILSPDQVNGFRVGIRPGQKVPGFFHSLPISFRVDADRYRWDQSVKKNHIFYEFIHSNKNFTLYGRTEVIGMELEYSPYIFRHSDKQILRLHTKKQLLQFMGLPENTRTRKWLRKMNGRWNFEALVELMKK
jgi:hypothetical protein